MYKQILENAKSQIGKRGHKAGLGGVHCGGEGPHWAVVPSKKKKKKKWLSPQIAKNFETDKVLLLDNNNNQSKSHSLRNQDDYEFRRCRSTVAENSTSGTRRRVFRRVASDVYLHGQVAQYNTNAG